MEEFIALIVRVLSADNIAIMVLLGVVALQFVYIRTLLNGLLATKDVLEKIAVTLALINERIRHD
jgi:hypothetical protein